MGEDKKKGAVKKEESPKKKVSDSKAAVKGSKENVNNNNNASPKKADPASKKKAEEQKAAEKKAEEKKAGDKKAGDKKADAKKAEDKKMTPKKDSGDKKAEEKKEEEAKAKSPEVESKDLPKAEEDKPKEEGGEKEKEKKEENGADPKTPEVEEATNGAVVRSQSVESDQDWVIRLTYFDGQGRAELIRMILAAGEVEYVDRRVTRQRWLELKDSTPFGQLPVLECEGHILAQSHAIARYLAKRTGLYGDSILDQARADAIVDFVGDFFNKWLPIFRAEDLEKQVSLIDDFFDVFLPGYMTDAEQMLKNGGGEYFVGGKLSYADIAMFQALWSFTDPEDPFYRTLPEPISKRFSVIKHFPLLSALLDRVASVPGIRNWLQTRPLGLF